MNVELPHFPDGAAAQFWWLSRITIVVVVVMLALFGRKRWV